MSRLPAAIALAILCLLQAWTLLRAPPAWSPAQVAITLRPGATIALGSYELAASQADQEHLAVRRSGDGRWFVRNLSATRQLVLQRGEHEQRVGSLPLAPGQRFRAGAMLFQVGDATGTEVKFTRIGQAPASDPHHRWRYDGAVLYRDGSPLPACPDARFAARAAALWNRWAPHALTIARPMSFGGNLYCDNRLGIGNLAGGSAFVARQRGALVLASGSPDGERAPLLAAPHGGAETDLARAEEPLAGVSAMTVGRTRLLLADSGDTMTMTPTRHVNLFAVPQRHLPPQVSWRWQERGLWTWQVGRAPWLALALAVGAAAWSGLAWQRGSWPYTRGTSPAVHATGLAATVLAIAGIAALLMQRAGTPPGAAWSMLLACVALWSCLLMPGRVALATGAGILLLGVGLLVQLELGLGALESSWLRYYQKSVALLAIGLGIGIHVRLRLRDHVAVLPQARTEWLLAGLAALTLLTLGMQVIWGDETGVFDIQPVEFAKLALTALTAHCLAVGLGWHPGSPQHDTAGVRWLRLAAPTLVFLALLAVALVQVDDYSPLILLTVWSVAMALSYSLAARRLVLTGVLLCAGALAAGGIAYLRSGPPADPQALAQDSGFYADRFQVWLDPARHPHTGQQLLLGARAIAEGAWWGVDRRLGLASLGQPAGSVLHIPAVQDDFAPSFFLNRHGLSGALVLWCLQVLFLTGVLQTAARAHAAGKAARDFRQAWLCRFRCFALCGGAAFVLGHLLLSWGTNLAIFPIMGQPMSFLSAGGSHLLFFICPLLAFSAVSAQSLEENASCRSMSNTKS